MGEPAPLTVVEAAPVPSGGAAAWFDAPDGARLRVAVFRPPGPARGSVVLSGGRTEPIEKYFEVIGELTARGFVVLAHDWRGQGLSHRALADRLRGHARGYQAFLSDYGAILDAYEARLPKPWIAMGHSMGGCLTLLALAHGQWRRFAAALLSAPMLGVQTGAVPVGLARLLAGAFTSLGAAGGYAANDPGKPFEAAFEDNVITHDRARFARHRAQIAACPDLALGGPTWGWLDFAFKAGGWLARPANLAGVAIPVTICSAEEERLVDNAAQRRAAGALPKGRFVTIPGAYHELLMETDERRAQVWREFDALAEAAAPPA